MLRKSQFPHKSANRTRVTKYLAASVLAFTLLSNQAPAPAQAGWVNLYVTSGGAMSGACENWAHACDLTYALNFVALSGSSLWVKQGTYMPGNQRTDTFALKNGVGLYGGFAGTETQLSQRDPAAHLTILSGDIGTPGDASDNVYHVVTGSGTDSTAVLDGFTVTGGNSDEELLHPGGGGGIYSLGGSPTVMNVTFSGNISSSGGGGMCNDYGSKPTLTNVEFDHNTANMGGGMVNDHASSPRLTNVAFRANSATSSGGGMANFMQSNAILTAVTFIGNAAAGHGQSEAVPMGGGGLYNNASSPTLEEVTFDQNSAADQGGGMNNDNGSHPQVREVTFRGNKAGSAGGGVSNNSSNPTLTNVAFVDNTAGRGGGMSNSNSSSPIIGNVTFSGNSAVRTTHPRSFKWGGGMFNSTGSPILTNVTFNGNSADEGGGMYNFDSSPIITNVTMSGNSASSSGNGMVNMQGGQIRIDTSVFWNGGSDISSYFTSVATANSIVSGGCPGGTGVTATCTNVTDVDPRLGPLADNGGYTRTMALGRGSPAIDGCGVSARYAVTDQRGVARPQGRDCDLGAYEAEVSRVLSVTRADPSPARGSRVRFTVTFSEPVTGVDSSDFRLTATGVLAPSILGVTGSGATYGVTVDTGSGNGSIRLDVVDDESILNALDPYNYFGRRCQTSFSGGEAYAVQKSTPHSRVFRR